MNYELYDKLRGPQRSDEQPDESLLSVAGAVRVARGDVETVYELFLDERERVWAKPRKEEPSTEEKSL